MMLSPKSPGIFRWCLTAFTLWLLLLAPGYAPAADLEVDRTLRNSPMRIFSNLTRDNETIGVTTQGKIMQMGGTNSVLLDLILGKETGSTGTYFLYGGSLQVGSHEYIGYAGQGKFKQWSGVHTVSGSLFLGNQAGSGGEYLLKGGNLNVGDLAVNPGSTFTQKGGTFQSGGLDNSGSVIFKGGSTTIAGDAVNHGTIQVKRTNVTWGGTFTNYGAYISDPATQTFHNLTVEPTGYIAADRGDTYIIKGDLDIRCTQNAAWNTTEATLRFATADDGATDHKVSLGTANETFFLLAANGDGSLAAADENPLAWRMIEIAPDNRLILEGEPGCTLVVEELRGLEIEDGRIVNLISDIPIFFDPTLPVNDYLAAVTENHPGELLPVPLPASAWLFLSGLAGLALLCRRGGPTG